MESLPAIDTRPLFEPLHQELIGLLESLNPDDWLRPTLAGTWRIRDVAAHLLDGQLRALSVLRDGHIDPPATAIDGYPTLVSYLNQTNKEWITASQRLSPNVLLDLLRSTGTTTSTVYSSLRLNDPAVFPVSWAGEEASKNWMHLGREFTEWWHHQMQIRDAVGQVEKLLDRRWLSPLFDISLRALPYSYRKFDAPPNSTLEVVIGNERWSLVKRKDRWQLFGGARPYPTTRLRLAPDAAWRILFNAWSEEEALLHCEIEGDSALAEPFLASRSVMV